MKIFKEHLSGKYNAVIPSPYLAEGDISAGLNVQKAAEGGGWERRQGVTQLNTARVQSGAKIESIHEYLNPKQGDYHLITQVNELLLNSGADEFDILTEAGGTLQTEFGSTLRGVDASDPLEQSTGLGTTLGVAVGSRPGYSCVVGEDFIYADGSGPPIIWGGNNPFCEAFFVWDNSTSAYVDYTHRVVDGRTDTYAVLGNAASDKYYVISKQIANAIYLQFGDTVNTQAVTVTVKAWRSGSWTDVSATDGTGTTQTHDTDGSLSWTAGADTLRVLSGIMGYVYEVSFSGATDAVKIVGCRVGRPAAEITNKWDLVFSFVDGCLIYDGTDYTDELGAVSTESTSTYADISSADATYYIYLKTLEPPTGFGFAIISGKENTANAQVDQIELWTGNAWTPISTNITDETLDPAGDSSFNKTGTIWFDAASVATAQKRTFEGDSVPGYWSRISWDAALSADTQIYTIVYASLPESLPTYKGCFEFFGTLFLWGDPQYPNRLRYSPFDRPDVFSGDASGYTDPIGDASEIKECIQLYDYAVIFKETGVYAMDTDLKIRKVASLVGLGSLKTAHTVEVGIEGMNEEELVSVCIWQDLDGVYMYDAAKPKKVSGPISNYFDPKYPECISENDIRELRAFINPIKNTYHLITGTLELVYNYKTDEWYPPWERYDPLSCAKSVKGIQGRYKLLGGTNTGFIHVLNNSDTDVAPDGTTQAIPHHLTTRSIAVTPDNSSSLLFALRSAWFDVTARSEGNTTIQLYLNENKEPEDSGTIKSLVDTTKTIKRIPLPVSKGNVGSFKYKFSCSSAADELELWAILYTLEAEGEPPISE